MLCFNKPLFFWPASVNGTHAGDEREKERRIWGSFPCFPPSGVPMSWLAPSLDQGHYSCQAMYFPQLSLQVLVTAISLCHFD